MRSCSSWQYHAQLLQHAITPTTFARQWQPRRCFDVLFLVSAVRPARERFAVPCDKPRAAQVPHLFARSFANFGGPTRSRDQSGNLASGSDSARARHGVDTAAGLQLQPASVGGAGCGGESDSARTCGWSWTRCRDRLQLQPWVELGQVSRSNSTAPVHGVGARCWDRTQAAQ